MRSVWHDATMTSPRPVVLVHGAWHGAWCFAALQHALDELGVPSYAVDLPGHGASTQSLTDLHGDARHVAEVLAGLGRPAVLVGHSYGGAVVTQAATWHPDVAHVAFLAAFALLEGESVIGLLRSLPAAEVALAAAVRQCPDGTTVVDADGAVGAFYADCPPQVALAAVARLSPQPGATMGQTVTGSPLGRVPSTYVLCSRDEAVHPDHQAVMAARCDEIVTLDCAHSPFISRVDDVATLLHRLAVS